MCYVAGGYGYRSYSQVQDLGIQLGNVVYSFTIMIQHIIMNYETVIHVLCHTSMQILLYSICLLNWSVKIIVDV
ncbi:uncharacterized protein V1516DRAFT_677988, partial [Lipomyces oligophaga]|uniref:uncharacterized protein n=1 Tax=Lipomyces oligophaga TaxID=45792 RepID=UPI0034CEF1DF